MDRINGETIPLRQLWEWSHGHPTLEIGPDVRSRMDQSRATVEKALDAESPTYGVNTGFGRLSDIRIPHEDLKKLQLNLVRSHACGFGEPLTRSEVRAMMILRANVLAKGFSGARYEVLQKLVEALNADVVPHVPSRGSVGASGDLSPLAHLALVLIGEGKARLHHEWQHGHEALASAGIRPLTLEAKEGLALLNGTQAIGAVGGLALHRAIEWTWRSLIVSGLTLEGLLGTPTAYDERIHDARGHRSQIQVAEFLRRTLAGSEIRESHRKDDPRVQDAYCLRCIPQVVGAALQMLKDAQTVFEIETAAATDNPLVFANEDEMLSGGNFHGAPLAIYADAASMAIITMMSMIERRIDRLVNPELNEGLPPFLAVHPGLESGLMMLHVSATAALNEARTLAYPACADNTPTSGNKEDHVSMGMTSANKLKRVVELFCTVVSIEAMAGADAIEFRRPLTSSAAVEALVSDIRQVVPKREGDRNLSEDLQNLLTHWSL